MLHYGTRAKLSQRVATSAVLAHARQSRQRETEICTYHFHRKTSGLEPLSKLPLSKLPSFPPLRRAPTKDGLTEGTTTLMLRKNPNNITLPELRNEIELSGFGVVRAAVTRAKAGAARR